MTTMAGICVMAFFFTMGVLMVLLACALPEFGNNWYPLFVLLTYILAPIPACIMKGRDDSYGEETSVGADVATFSVAAIVMSGYGIPWVLWHTGTIVAGAAWLVVSGNTVIFCSILAYFVLFEGDDYSGL
eukprot:m.113192 g.113192  ORF g.113192 m.113192 type:complete len:130 (-) comp28254_c0_seq1:223-612(-)